MSAADPVPTAVDLDYPVRGRWRAEKSPARTVPSHGTHRFGMAYAIDFVQVDARGRSGPVTLRTLLTSEPPETYLGFGAPLTAPIAGTIARVHDAEADHDGGRSQFARAKYAVGQSARARAGWAKLAGNHVVIAIAEGGPYVLLAHLKLSSIVVAAGQRVATGDPIGQVGNTGNSTEPHVHLQVSNSLDWQRARGIPLMFRHPDGSVRVPNTREIVNV